MDVGFILDESYGRLAQSQWVDGEPKKSFWTGIRAPRADERYPVTTYRCTGCGYLESYAQVE
jgi:hypothetical protein